MALFPSTFIHIGGDECPKTEWAHSPAALARMKELKLVPETSTLADLQSYTNAKGERVDHPALHALQSWFTRQIDTYLTGKGRRLIGWDEILEGGLAPGAAVMSWRGEQGGIDAATQGHDVVMAPGEWTYFDAYQHAPSSAGLREPLAIGSLTTLAKAYSYDPIPAGLPAAMARHVLGSQAQLWTEYMPDEKSVEYMAWPRLLASAELMWTPKALKDFKHFEQRVGTGLKRLDAQDVNYRPPGGPRWPK
jgi:hexosaminidase